MTRHDKHDTIRHDTTQHDVTRRDATRHGMMRHDTTRHTTRRDKARHDTRRDTTRHHATWHATTCHDTAQFDLRVLHTPRLGINRLRASCFKEASYPQHLVLRHHRMSSVSDPQPTAKGQLPTVGEHLPPAADLPIAGGRACASARGEALPLREDSGDAAPPILDAVLIPAPSHEGGSSGPTYGRRRPRPQRVPL